VSRWRGKRLLVPIVALVAAMGLVACGDDDDDGGGGGGGGGGGKIAFLLPETQTARYETQDPPLFTQKVEELCPDCELLYQNADQDATKQQQQVEAAVTEQADVLVLDPVDSASAAGLANRAKQAGIPVISYDRLILDADLDYYVSFDSVKVGEQQGSALADALDQQGAAEGPIIQINGDPKDNNAHLFDEGATNVFEDRGIEVAQTYDTPDWLPENAQREMEQGITAVGKDGFAGAYVANDALAGAAIAAMQAAGLDPKTIPVTGQDAELTGIQRIVAGDQLMTVYKPIKPLADSAAELAVAVAQGEDPPEGLINGEEDNGSEQVPTVFLETIPVFKDNVQDTVIKDGYWSAGEICSGQYAQACQQAGIK
jgi:D-xylose transport system substrate-binding protein